MNYCKALFSGITKHLESRLQLANNTAARIVTKVRKSEDITPVVASLHCLPVQYRIHLQILLLMLKTLRLAPSYFQELLTPFTSNSTPRSQNVGLLVIPGQIKITQEGGRAFSCRAPKCCNAFIGWQGSWDFYCLSWDSIFFIFLQIFLLLLNSVDQLWAVLCVTCLGTLIQIYCDYYIFCI